MKLHQIRYLIAVAECGSVRAAARGLGVTQAAITQGLRELEEEQQLPLFERQATGMALTLAGRALLRHAQLIHTQMEQAEAEMAQLRHCGAQTPLSVAVTPWLAQSLLPEVLRRFREELPQVRLELFDGLSALAHPRLRSGTLDLLVGRITPACSDLHATPLFRYELAVVARAGHPLSGARSLEQLLDSDWLLNYTPPEADTLMQGLFLCHDMPVPPRIHLAHSPSLLLELIAHSDMLSFVPWPLIEALGMQGRIVPLPLQQSFAPRTAGLVQRGTGALSWPAQRFVAHLLSVVHDCAHSPDPMVQRVLRSIDLLV